LPTGRPAPRATSARTGFVSKGRTSASRRSRSRPTSPSASNRVDARPTRVGLRGVLVRGDALVVRGELVLVIADERLHGRQRGAKDGAIGEPAVEDTGFPTRDRDGPKAVDVGGKNDGPAGPHLIGHHPLSPLPASSAGPSIMEAPSQVSSRPLTIDQMADEAADRVERR